ncbi:hypothetical protein M23134_00936 [Microscilla marina ATCC 23134]|uniref:Uncharacterized protein n=1 Tax=Microscilla marina ATCC 23134 TaxID=313606 RepID=A2A001_MICM2|nr:hypothetical protein M23134_00936 [Microscilla marina ATCC 23134]
MPVISIYHLSTEYLLIVYFLGNSFDSEVFTGRLKDGVFSGFLV